MNNNLYFNRHHPQVVSAKHAETIKKSTSLRTSARSFTPSPCPHLTKPPSPVSADVLYGRPLMDVSLVAIVWMDPGLETRRLSNNNWYDLCNEGNVMEKTIIEKSLFQVLRSLQNSQVKAFISKARVPIKATTAQHMWDQFDSLQSTTLWHHH